MGQGYSARIDVTVLNEGEIPLGFSVSVCVNATIIGTKAVPLLNSNQATVVSFAWYTAGWNKSTYQIRSAVYVNPN